jgi:phi LC3 family holin
MKHMINWKIRLMNKQFWLSLIPALALTAQAVAAVFGWEIDLTTAVGKLLTVVNTVFALLVVLGIVMDPTTEGIGDSERALGYEKPYADEKD